MLPKRVDWLITELNIIGGTEVFIRQTAPRLRDLGWDLRVITLVAGGNLIDELRQDRIRVIELGLRHKLDVGVVFRLMKIWRQAPPDILHTHLYHAGILGRAVARWMGISPVVVHQHGPESGRSHLRVLLDGKLSRWVNCYVSTCAAVADILQTREQIPPSQIEVVYNGIPTSNESLAEPFPPEWPVPEEQTTLISVGRLASEKGQFELLESVGHLKDALPVHVIFVGTGPQLEALQARSQQLGVQNLVSFVGLQKDVYSWLCHADIFVLASEWEGVSLAILEAMAAGLPVIATAVGGTPEVVLDGETGILVPPGDSQALAEAISQLVANPAECQRLGQAGQQRVRQHFSIEKTVQRFSQIYTELLTKS